MDSPDFGGIEEDEDEGALESIVGWSLIPSLASHGQYLAHFGDGTLAILAPPGVAIAEPWDSDELLYWRRAIWESATGFELGEPPSDVQRVGTLGQTIAQVPADSVPGLSIHDWMIGATEAHADAVERLVALQEREPAPGSEASTAMLRKVARDHREQAARYSDQPRPLVRVDRSPHDLAQVVVDQPEGVLARVQRILEQRRQLPEFAASVEQLEDEFGESDVRAALTSLVFAKHYSYSWQLTAYVRYARRSLRRSKRAAQRRLSSLEGALARVAHQLERRHGANYDSSDASVAVDRGPRTGAVR